MYESHNSALGDDHELAIDSALATREKAGLRPERGAAAAADGNADLEIGDEQRNAPP